MSELFCLSETKRNSSNYFIVHASFGSFLTLRKERIKTFLESIPMTIGTKKKN